MKKLFLAIAFLTAIVALSSCEQSDCLCKYYDENEQLIGYDSWDGESVSSSECASFENDNTIEINGDDVVASSVYCSTSW